MGMGGECGYATMNCSRACKRIPSLPWARLDGTAVTLRVLLEEAKRRGPAFNMVQKMTTVPSTLARVVTLHCVPEYARCAASSWTRNRCRCSWMEYVASAPIHKDTVSPRV